MVGKKETTMLQWWEDPDFEKRGGFGDDWSRPSTKIDSREATEYYRSLCNRYTNLSPWLKAAEGMQHIKLSPDQEAACNID